MAAKRGQNQGSIYWWEERQRWVCAVTLDGGKRKVFYGKTKREVQEKLTKALTAQQQGVLNSARQETTEKFLRGWVKDIAKPTVRARTLVGYQIIVDRHLVPGIGRKPLEKVNALDLQSLYNQKLADGLAPRTVGGIHRVLHRAFQDAMKLGLIVRNPCDLVSAPRAAKPEVQFLSAQEARQFLEAAKGDPLEALYFLALTTGMRQEELLGLKWDCVDFDNGIVHVRRTVFALHKVGMTWGEPKSATSNRRITLTPQAVVALRKHRVRQLEGRLLAGENWEEQDIVFPNTVGRPYNAKNLWSRSFGPLLEKAGVKRIRFHDLRHSTASLLFAMGAHPKVVQELLGHSNISMTMDVYSHSMPTLQAEAVNRLGSLLDTGTDG